MKQDREMGYNEWKIRKKVFKDVIDLKILILFHTITGNNFLIARQFKAAARECGHDVLLKRIEDPTINDLRNTYEIINEYYDAIMKVDPIEKQDLEDKDVIVIGSPTYYGNCSGRVKGFFDSLVDFWSNNTLYKKKLMTFTTVGDINGGGEMCLKSLITLGQHMGMQFVPVSPAMTTLSISSYGIKHFVGEFADKRPGTALKAAIKVWVESI